MELILFKFLFLVVMAAFVCLLLFGIGAVIWRAFFYKKPAPIRLPVKKYKMKKSRTASVGPGVYIPKHTCSNCGHRESTQRYPSGGGPY